MLGLLLLALVASDGTDASEAEPLEPPALHEQVVVTASRQPQRLSDASALVTVVTHAELAGSPNLVLDTQLLQVPGFALFRRTGSLAAHPTTQGVSLRGLAASGASRSLVLRDGVPLNDPFGGWVYWNRQPPGMLDSVEIVRGATSQLYGNAALAGTIQLLTRRQTEHALELSARGGSRETWDLAGLAARANAKRGFLAAARMLQTDGYFALRPEDRGPVDTPVALAARSLYARARHGAVRLDAEAYWETRDNGTRLQDNDSRLLGLEARWEPPGWQGAAFVQSQRLRSRFSRVAADRTSEVLTADQDFPSRAAGASVSRRLETGTSFGADWRRVAWQGQSQNLAGVFAQKLLAPHPRLELLLGLRLDLWENARVQTTANPRVGIVFRPSGTATLRASAYRGFRAPTLNELYRPFRVGNVETLANSALLEEHLLGAEAGLDLYPSRSLLLRLAAFHNRLEDPIGNATLEITSSGVLRQRRNLGAVRLTGFEAEARALLGGHWSARGGYLFSGSRVVATGLELPQAPRHQASVAVSRDGALRAHVQARWIAQQYEDDLNQLPLAEAFVVDLSVGYAPAGRLELLLAVENLLDSDNVVGRTPLELLDMPRTLLVGLRFR